MSIRLILADYDGTLAHRGWLSARTVAAMKAVQNAGVAMVIASGRDKRFLFEMQDAIGFCSDTVYHNGAGACDPNRRVLYSRPFAPSAYLAAVDVLMQAGVSFLCYNEDAVFALATTPHETSEAGEWSVNNIYFRPCSAAQLKAVPNPEKIYVFGKDPLLLERARQALAALPDLSLSRSGSSNIEVNPEGVHKGVGLAFLAKRLGVPLAQTMAFGDNLNDLGMLRLAGVSVAMGNAGEEIKAQCRLTAPSSQDDGVAVFLEKLLENGFQEDLL